MNYIRLKNISKSYGERLLFEEVELYINKGDKVALIAKNGTGKSSLLDIIVGLDQSDTDIGVREVHPDIRLGYMPQEADMEPAATVYDYLFERSAHPGLRALYTYQMMSDDDKASPAAHQLLEKLDALKAWDAESSALEVLYKLGLSEVSQTIGTLSGGQRRRLSLARVLSEEPDLLVLDEPTNHLDISMIEWLEEYLSRPNRTLLLVSHDRYLIDKVCNSVVELDHQTLQKYSGGYADYLEKKEAAIANAEARHGKQVKRYKTELEWMRRQPKARTTKAKSRIDKFHDIKKEVYGKSADAQQQWYVKPERLGSKILECQYISKAYGDRVLFDQFHYKFSRQDRVGIIGPNGAGKTSFINVLLGLDRPDSGKVVHGSTVKFGYYSQIGLQAEPNKRVLDVVRDVAEYIPLEKGKKLTAERLLENFLFERPKQEVLVSKLSGGERRRLHLLTILMQNPNFLILDEPTNDLDIQTLQVLEEYLVDFTGVLLIVSHDRFFMDKIVDHLFVFDGQGGIRDFPGNYSTYRRHEPSKTSKSIVAPPVSAAPKAEDYQLRKERKNRLRNIEQKIDRLSTEKEKINQRFLDEVLDTEVTIELSARLTSISSEVEDLEMEWMNLVDE